MEALLRQNSSKQPSVRHMHVLALNKTPNSNLIKLKVQTTTSTETSNRMNILQLVTVVLLTV